MVKKAAWRYRFTRRWQQEQAKQFDPEFGREGGDEEWDEVPSPSPCAPPSLPPERRINDWKPEFFLFCPPLFSSMKALVGHQF